MSGDLERARLRIEPSSGRERAAFVRMDRATLDSALGEGPPGEQVVGGPGGHTAWPSAGTWFAVGGGDDTFWLATTDDDGKLAVLDSTDRPRSAS